MFVTDDAGNTAARPGSSADSAPRRCTVAARTPEWTVLAVGCRSPRHDLGAAHRIVSADAPALGGGPGDEPAGHARPVPERHPARGRARRRGGRRRRPGRSSAAVEARNAVPPGPTTTCWCSSTPTSRCTPTPSSACELAFADPDDDRGLRLLRRCAVGVDDGLDLPQPAPPPRAPDQPRPDRHRSGPASARSGGRVRSGRRVRRRALPRPVDRGHRPRAPARRARRARSTSIPRSRAST